jgi:hypothetical protein
LCYCTPAVQAHRTVAVALVVACVTALAGAGAGAQAADDSAAAGVREDDTATASPPRTTADGERGTATPRRRPAPPPPQPPPPPVPQPPVATTEEPLGFARFGRRPDQLPPQDLVPLPDRWRIGWPRYDRYPGLPGEYPYTRGRWWDPYDLNVLKGDYPILGTHAFLNLTLRSDTLFEGRRLPVPSDVSAARPDSAAFFGEGESLTIEENVLVSVELFHGLAGFKPRDWELRATPVFNVNYLDAREQGVVNIDPRRGTERFDSQIAFQELFADVKLADVSPYYDTVSLRAGIQQFTSDFRGFLFSDFEPGAKLAGTWAANRIQWNLAYFHPVEKDTNSALNTIFDDRGQNIVVANALMQDVIWPGYTTQLSLHYNGDDATRHFDQNGFLVRPANIGSPRPHEIRVGYLGWTGDGHINRINVSHAVFEAVGEDSHNPIAGRDQNINAQMAALELSIDRDWLRFKGSVFWASGDDDPTDATASGFDAIFDNPFFAGGPFSFWQRQGIKLTGTNVNLTNRFSLLPNLRSSKDEGQANFVNPGILIATVGLSGKLKPKLFAELNASYLRFHETAVPQLVLLQRGIGNDLGVDVSLGLKYRPLLIDNIILVVGAAGFTPLGGFREIYGSQTLFSAFTALTLTF